MDSEEMAIEDKELIDRLHIIDVVIILGIYIRKTLLIKWIVYNQDLTIYVILLITLPLSVQTYQAMRNA